MPNPLTITPGEVVGFYQIIGEAARLENNRRRVDVVCLSCGSRHSVLLSNLVRIRRGTIKRCKKCRRPETTKHPRKAKPVKRRIKPLPLHGLTELQRKMISSRWSNP